MSTVAQPRIEPSWKEEVNRRLAAHKNRKGDAEQSTRPEPAAAMNSKAAEAAARVAARYAKAPTYSQMQAEEARVAVRAAQIATKVALEAQAAAESALAELHAATRPPRGRAIVAPIARISVAAEPTLPFVEQIAQPETTAATLAPETVPEPNYADSVIPAVAEPEFAVAPVLSAMAACDTIPVVSIAGPGMEIIIPELEPATAPVVLDRESLSVRWDTDLPSRTIQMPFAAPAPPQEEFSLDAEDWWTPAQVHDTLHNEPLEVNTPPANANLIEFPRELVATRKMRPRLADATPVEGQLSIFEVDPATVSTMPEVQQAQPTVQLPAYVGPEWSGIALDAHPERSVAPAAATEQESKPDVAPLSRRLMTLVVDGSMILASSFAIAVLAFSHMPHVPAPKIAELFVAAGLVLTGLAYNALFLTFGLSTPGMFYAGIALSTFDDDIATASQTRRRFGAMLLSLAPFGLGMVWAIFDEDHLSWHDRMSGTYLRKKI